MLTCLLFDQIDRSRRSAMTALMCAVQSDDGLDMVKYLVEEAKAMA